MNLDSPNVMSFVAGGSAAQIFLNASTTPATLNGSNSGTFRLSLTPTNSNPAYSFKDDNDTGLQNPAANVVSVVTGGSERARLDASGNLGIGTTSPQTTLQVEGVISPATNNTYTLGNATYRFTEVYATNGVINTSDRREKNDIANTDLGLDFINKLRPVSYRWNTGVDSEVHYGLIAQEAEQVLADLGKKEETSIVTHDAETDRYGVRYSELISPLIKAVQELYENLMGVQSRQGALAREIASVKDRVEVENARKDKEIEKLKQANAAQAEEMAELKTYLCRHEKSAPFCK